MSAVMSTLSMISGGRRAHRKLASSRKSGQLSDAGGERTRSHQELSRQQRSASLQTLETGGVVNLDSLEAKMASIEVSLGGRRHGAGAREPAADLDALRSALGEKDALIQNLKKQLNASLSAARLASSPPASRPSSTGGSVGGAGGAGGEDAPVPALSADERRALDERAAAVRVDLDKRRANIQELRRRLEKTHVTDNIDTRIQQAELQYQLGREELELLGLAEQARALALLQRRADQAAKRPCTLYSTVRECGGAATLVAAEAAAGSWGAATRGLAAVVDWAAEGSALRPGDRLVEVNGSLVLSCRGPPQLQRAVAAAAPASVLVLRAAPANGYTPTATGAGGASIRALRLAADDAERASDDLRAHNTRLTHRISYLEEQVAELLAAHAQPVHNNNNENCITVNKTKKNVTNISITSESGGGGGGGGSAGGRAELQVFQKGPDITALVARLPGPLADHDLPLLRPRSDASGASSRRSAHRSPPHSPPRLPPAHRSHSSHSLDHRPGRMRHSLSHHCIHAGDYSAETDAAIRMIERNQRHIEKQKRLKAERLGRSRTEPCPRSDSDAEPEPTAAPAADIKKVADRIEESIKKTNWAERKTLSIIEQLKRSQRTRKLKKTDSADDVLVEAERHRLYQRIDGKVLENAHKSSRRSSRAHSRSARSSERESEWSDHPGGEACAGGEDGRATRQSADGRAGTRPAPPRKPLRLSLHKARSTAELPASDGEAADKRPAKRGHTRTTPRPERRELRPSAPAPAAAAPAADQHYPPPAPLAHRRLSGFMQQAKWC